jgi:hypothetical protein
VALLGYKIGPSPISRGQLSIDLRFGLPRKPVPVLEKVHSRAPIAKPTSPRGLFALQRATNCRQRSVETAKKPTRV